MLSPRPAAPRVVFRTPSRAASTLRAPLPYFAWGFVAVTAGLVIGFAAVVLPPTGAFGLVAVAGLVLLWVMPELRAVPDRIVRRFLFAMVLVDFCVPAYYTISVAGLPWISARRVVTFPLILLYSLAVSGSPAVRSRIAAALKDNRALAICAIGFLIMALLSILTSISPTTSLSGLVEAIVAWYAPMFVVLYVVRSELDVLAVIRICCWSALFVALGGLACFMLQKNVFIAIMPHWIVDSLLANSPAFERTMEEANERNGLYRAASIFSVSLSFAEFEAMIIPFGYFFFVYGAKFRERLFGAIIVVGCLGGIFVSGARGGYLSAAVATAVFAGLWIVRSTRFNPRSLAPSVMIAVAVVAFLAFAVLIATPGRIHNTVLGGGSAAYSDEARYEQWRLGMPRSSAIPLPATVSAGRRDRRLSCLYSRDHRQLRIVITGRDRSPRLSVFLRHDRDRHDQRGVAVCNGSDAARGDRRGSREFICGLRLLSYCPVSDRESYTILHHDCPIDDPSQHPPTPAAAPASKAFRGETGRGTFRTETESVSGGARSP